MDVSSPDLYTVLVLRSACYLHDYWVGVLATDSGGGGESGGLGLMIEQCFHRFVGGKCVATATLCLGDCLEGPRVQADAVITDPPYGMDWDTDTTRFSGGAQVVSRGKDWGDRIAGDNQPFDPSPWLSYPAVVLWGFNHYAQRLPVGTTLVWVKRNDTAFQSFLSDGELAWMKGGYGVYCFRDVPSLNDKGLHPTQKTVPLMAWCMEISKLQEGATVLDPYMGSGTTGIACLRTNRNYIGIEKDPKHYQTAVERIKREVSQGVLL